MGFFGKLLKNAVGFIPGIGPAISAGLDVAGSLSKGAQAGREKENAAASNAANFQLDERRQAEQALQNRAGIDLQQRQFAQNSNTDAIKKALQSSLLMNLKDGSFNRPQGVSNISFSGGLRPSALGQQGQDVAKLMNQQAMQRLLTGEKFDAMPAIERTAPATYKKPGFWENFLGAAGTVGNAIGGLQDQQRQNTFQSDLLKRIQELNKPQIKLPGQEVPVG